jgi:acyl-coenzyme A synthetase/AMP-(fatty) acid ligase
MIFFWAKADPNRPAIIQSDMTISYREFAEAIDAVSARIKGYGFEREQPVAVAIDHPVRQLAVGYALLRAGYTTAFAGRGMMPFLRLNGISNVIFVGEGQMLSGGRNIAFHDSWLRRESKNPLVWDPVRPSQATATPLIFFTSGTTGTPKKMILPGEALLEWEFIEKGARCQVDSLTEVRIGGGFTSPDLVRRVQACLCRTVITQYGATETGLVAFANHEAIADIPNAVGFVIPGMQIEILDDTNNPAPAGERGRIRFHSSYFARVHAANNPADAGKSEKSWWYPGDLGRLTADGILCVDGRADDVINSGGAKFDGLALDDVVRAFPGIKDGGVCGIRGPSGVEELWVGVVPETDIDISALKAWIEANAQHIIVGKILMIQEAPRNVLGKLQRHLLKDLLIETNKRAG